ncbi:segregation and condensation protein B [Clostridia bacterium]|nr:segregation and condensation protein B [Clostridia bacterium]
MELSKLDKLLEGILLVSGAGVTIADLVEKLELQQSEIDGAIEKLKKKYNSASGIQIITYNGKVQFATNPVYADEIARVLNPIREKELSKSALEAAAIVAYKQPVTRLDIEEVRGVNSDYALSLLLKHNLIRVVGRKEAVGKPLLFGTTDEFLKRFQITDLKDLPDYDTLIDRLKVIDEGIAEEDRSLYNNFEIPAEEPVPEFLQGEEDLQKIE